MKGNSASTTTNATGVHDPTDNAEFKKELSIPSVFQDRAVMVESVARPSVLRVDNDYMNTTPKENATATTVSMFAKQKKGKKSKKLKSKRRRRTQTGIPEVSRGHVAKLRKQEQDGDDEAGDDNDEHYEAMVRARRKAVAKKRHEESNNASIQHILKAIHDVNGNEKGHDQDVKMEDKYTHAVERGSHLMYDEMQAFLERVADTTSDQQQQKDNPFPGSTKTEEISDVDANEHNTASAVKNIKIEDENISMREPIKQKGDDEKTPTQAISNDNNATVENDSTKLHTDAKDDGASDKPRLTGIAATLKRLRESGQLMKKKREQSGRARDKRLVDDDDKDDDGDTHKRNKAPHVKLAYVDDYGNELTPKEAFRSLCHKFHGNAPGKNKNEKRLKKLLENMRVRNMSGSDTPLSSVAALRQETRKTGSAHVVLSGTQAFQQDVNAVNDAAAEPHEREHGDDGKKESKLEDEECTLNEESEEPVQFLIDGPGSKPAKRRRR